MRTVFLAAVLALSGAGGAAAGETAQQLAQRTDAPSKPHVVICGKDGMAQRALKREHGAVVWTTSAEVLAAVREGQGWSTPRCISNLEYWRVGDQLRRARRAELARLRARQVLAQR